MLLVPRPRCGIRSNRVRVGRHDIFEIDFRSSSGDCSEEDD
jgi:hypothetical protein